MNIVNIAIYFRVIHYPKKYLIFTYLYIPLYICTYAGEYDICFPIMKFIYVYVYYTYSINLVINQEDILIEIDKDCISIFIIYIIYKYIYIYIVN